MPGERFRLAMIGLLAALPGLSVAANPPALCPRVDGDLQRDGTRFHYQLPVGGPGMIVQVRSAEPQGGFDLGHSDFYAVITARCAQGRWQILKVHTQSFAD